MSETLPGTPGPLPEALPGAPGPLLADLWDCLEGDARWAFYDHLMGDTSAEWLAQVIRDEGWQMSASTIRTYRRSLRQIGV